MRITAKRGERLSEWGDEETVIALLFPYDTETREALKEVLSVAKACHSTFGESRWDKVRRFWWCYEEEWECCVRSGLEDRGVPVLDARDEPVTAKQEPPKRPSPQPPAQPQPHEVLGVAITAGEAEIQAAYHALARQWHPDRIPLDTAPELRQLANRRMAEINVAFDMLKTRFRRTA